MKILSGLAAAAVVSLTIAGVAVQSASAGHRLGHDETKLDHRYKPYHPNKNRFATPGSSSNCHTVRTPRGLSRVCR